MANDKLPEGKVYGSTYWLVKEITSDIVDRLMQTWACNIKTYITEFGDSVVLQGSVIDKDLIDAIKILHAANIPIILNIGKPGNPPSCPPGGCPPPSDS